MGNLCKFKFNQNNNNITTIEEGGQLKRKFTEKEIDFWQNLRELGFVKISEIKNKNVLFNYSDLIYENFLSISTIMNNLITNENFFLFNDLLEILLAIIDFTQIIFHLKKKYEMDNFFLINFNKFSLMREKNTNKNLFCKLVYLDHKLADFYNNSEIIVKEDSNLFSSFSFMNNSQLVKNMINTTKSSKNSINKDSYVFSSSNINYNKNNYRMSNNEDNDNDSFDLNSFFYSKCNERYKRLKDNYSLEKCEYFYTECYINFLMKFLIKKTIICDSMLSHDFHNFKNKLKNTFNNFIKNYHNKISLQKLKEILTNIYLNNYEYNNFKEKCEKLLTTRESTNNILLDKIILHENLSLQLIYGDCDIQNNLSRHNLNFIYDIYFKQEENSIFNLYKKNNFANIQSFEEDVNGELNELNKSKNNSYKSKKSNNLFDKNMDNEININDKNKKKDYLKNKVESLEKNSICLNCSKKLILNNLPTEISNMTSLIKYNEEYLEKKFPNFSLEKVLNYFCYFFSFENSICSNDKNELNNSKQKLDLDSLKRNNSTISYNFNIFSNIIYGKNPKKFYVYKKNEYSIMFIYENQKNYILNLDEFFSKSDNKLRNSNLI